MVFTAAVLLAGVLVALARGGRLGNLREVHLAWVPMLVAGLGLQVAVDLAADRGAVADGLAAAGIVASQVLVLAFVVRNRAHRGMLIVGAGFLLNAVVIVANGAMPVDPDAIRRIGVADPGTITGKHELMTDATLLPWLGDRVPVPWLRMILSVGDLVLGVGVVVLADGLLGGGRRRSGTTVRARGAAGSGRDGERTS